MTCEQLSNWIAGDRLPQASWRRRLAVRLHLVMCQDCRRYVRQLRIIAAEARQWWSAIGRHESSLGILEQKIVQEVIQEGGTASDPGEGEGQ